MAIRLVIFDCDGVLFTSDAANVAFYNAVLERVGEPPLDDVAEVACHALASAQLFEKYYGDRPAMLERIRETAHAMDYGPFYGLMQPREDLLTTLSALRERYHVAMATNRGKTTQGVLAHFGLGDHFDFAVGVLDVERPKPHPDLLIECVRRVGVAPSEAVYVGDQRIDEAAAAAAGTHFIGMGEVVADAALTVDTLSDLGALVERL